MRPKVMSSMQIQTLISADKCQNVTVNDDEDDDNNDVVDTDNDDIDDDR